MRVLRAMSRISWNLFLRNVQTFSRMLEKDRQLCSSPSRAELITLHRRLLFRTVSQPQLYSQPASQRGFIGIHTPTVLQDVLLIVLSVHFSFLSTTNSASAPWVTALLLGQDLQMSNAEVHVTKNRNFQKKYLRSFRIPLLTLAMYTTTAWERCLHSFPA